MLIDRLISNENNHQMKMSHNLLQSLFLHSKDISGSLLNEISFAGSNCSHNIALIFDFINIFSRTVSPFIPFLRHCVCMCYSLQCSSYPAIEERYCFPSRYPAVSVVGAIRAHGGASDKLDCCCSFLSSTGRAWLNRGF